MIKRCVVLAVVLLLCTAPSWSMAADGKALVESTCAKCHDLGRVRAAYGVKDQAAWSATVARMLAKKNAPTVSHEEHGIIVDWLAAQKK